MAQPTDLAASEMRAATGFHRDDTRRQPFGERQDLDEMRFDPVLWHGHRKIAPLEPDLAAAQDNIQWCDRRASGSPDATAVPI